MSEFRHLIWSRRPASEWAEGYPIGNGRIGGMVLGDPLKERIGLNHDRLWRDFWAYQEHHTAGDLAEIRRLCLRGEWDDAHDLIIKRIPVSSRALYVNPFVPACDLGLYPFHTDDDVSDYERRLDMDAGIATVSYVEGGIRYRRECFSSWPAGVIVIRISGGQAGCVRGTVTLSRLLDPDCTVTGSSALGEVSLEGEFEEGVRFAVVVRVVQRGGRLTGGRSEYVAPPGEMPPEDINGMQFIFRDNETTDSSVGVSTCFDSADEVLLLVSIGTEDESPDPLAWCRQRIASIPPDFDHLRTEHVRDHRKLYQRVNLILDGKHSARPSDELVHDASKSGAASPELIEKLFNLGRYLAITSGRPAPQGAPPSAPINLQGMWCQDRRPPWDCDYHLDLNLEMCYWPLEMVNLPELVDPLTDWLENVLPEARLAARDIYGCGGAHLCVVADLRHIGNMDDLSFGWVGSGAWIAQILWHHWEYTGDESFLQHKLYPYLKEICRFYEDLLVEDKEGQLVPVPSSSPEMGIKGRRRAYSSLSSPATIDLELIREAFTNLLTAGRLLGQDSEVWPKWQQILDKIPAPVLDEHGVLQEWLENHDPIDPGHRHRSHFVNFCPGDRMTPEDTPEYAQGIRKALAIRQEAGRDRGCSLTWVWDAQIRARLYEAENAMDELSFTIANHVMDNLLMSLLDWRDTASTLNWFRRRLFQIEASIGAVAAIGEMLLQDRRRLLRLLPALPGALSEGSVTGLRGRGGFEVDISWKGGSLTKAKIRSLRGENCRVKVFRIDGEFDVLRAQQRVASSQNGEVEFATEIDQTYILRPTGVSEHPG